MLSRAFLTVSGWIELPGEVIRDVEPHMTYGAQLPDDAWLPVKDGRPSCANVPAGHHGIYLVHTDPARGRTFSEAVFFDVAAGDQKELHLQLFAGRRLEGRLDSNVPRPVTNGEVLVNLQIGQRDLPDATQLRPFRAKVEADGSFVLVSLPPGDGQIIGICDGWASARVLADERDTGLGLEGLDLEEREERIALLGDHVLVPQSIDPASLTGPFELAMERTATVELTLVDPDGAPIEGARVHFWPNVHWRTGSAQMFMHREYAAMSDERGRATVANIPRGDVTGGVQHARFSLPKDARGRRHLEVQLEAGKTTTMRIELEKRTDE